MNLGELLRTVAGRAPFDPATVDRVPAREAAQTVSGVMYDSRQATSGALFVALRGAHADGATFARDAVAYVIG